VAAMCAWCRTSPTHLTVKGQALRVRLTRPERWTHLGTPQPLLQARRDFLTPESPHDPMCSARERRYDDG